MAEFGAQIKKRLKELEAAGADLPRIVGEVLEGATIEAVNAAVENTPPNGGAAIAGTGTRTGEMAQAWETDSVTKARRRGGYQYTELNNNKQYSSYVNDGHRMDRHFVPGLIVNGNMLERSPDGKGGIVVGTRTDYVPGLYMKEKATEKFRETVRKDLDRRVRERFERE